MFDRNPELSPDLVWLLQSHKVEDGLLIRLLVQESYARLQTFWEALLNDVHAAHEATKETLCTALLKANSFHEPQSVHAWLIGLAIDLYRKDRRKLAQGGGSTPGKDLHLDQLAPATRLAAVLRFRLNYSPQEVAGFLGEKLPSTETRLSAARQLLLDQVNQGGRSGVNPAEGDALTQAFQRAYPTQVLSEEELEFISQEIIECARRKRSQKKRAAYWNEIAVISAVILVVLLWVGSAHLDAPVTTPNSPTKIALVVATAQPTRQPTATPTPKLTATPFSWGHNTSVTPNLSTPTPIPDEAFYTVQEGDTLLGIASSLGTSVDVLRSLNRLPEAAIMKPGQHLLKPSSLSLDIPTSSQRSLVVQPTSTPLPVPPSVNEILARWENFPVNSLWMDAHILYRGPQGYLGEAQTWRMQIWSSQDGRLIATGPDKWAPDKVFEAFKLKSDQQGVIYIAKPGNGKPWFVSDPSEEEIKQYDSLLSDILNIQSYHWGDQMIHTILVGSGNVGDRPAYILRQFDLQQHLLRTIWVDQVSGLPLHTQVHDPYNPKYIMSETLVSGLEINPDIPPALFDPHNPWLGGYAKDSSGAPFEPGEGQSPWIITPPSPINPPYNPAPTSLNLANSALQLQFAVPFSIFAGLTPDNLYAAEIFTGGKYLGPAKLPNPFYTLCARSPDGKRMAYAATRTNTLDVYTRSTRGSFIRWIDLSDPETKHMPVANLLPFSFVFAPDGKQLAMYAEDFDNLRGIYLLDLENEEARLLQNVDSATSLAWKPDGKQLAYISRSEDTQASFNLVVLNVGSGKIVSRQSLPIPDVPPTSNAQTWLPVKWGVPFPVEMGNLGACAAPPAGK